MELVMKGKKCRKDAMHLSYCAYLYIKKCLKELDQKESILSHIGREHVLCHSSPLTSNIHQIGFYPKVMKICSIYYGIERYVNIYKAHMQTQPSFSQWIEMSQTREWEQLPTYCYDQLKQRSKRKVMFYSAVTRPDSLRFAALDSCR